MERKKEAKSKKAEGQVIVILAVALVGLLVAIGLAVDVTGLYISRQNLQRALDSAAIAGSRKLPSQTAAEDTVYQVMRLHGYDFDPATKPLTFSYPVYSPPRKVITVEGATEAEFYFLSVIGWNRATVATSGEAESAPLDVYLILDLSLSMVYDTERPGHVWWRTCNRWRDYPCISELCNDGRYCDPLDTKIKPAAKYFVDLLSSQYDRIGLVTYNRDGMQVLPLEYDFNVVKNAIDNLDAYEHGGRSTNIGDGIMYGHQSIASEGRMDSIWAMVLLTDGRANVYRDCPGCPSDCSALACGEVHEGNHGDADSEGWAINNAIDTWHEHEVVIYTIAYGDIFTQDPSYQDLMILVADITDNGTVEGSTENFWVAPDEDALIIALEDIAERVFTRLLR